MNIAIISLYGCNFGNKLQNYALLKLSVLGGTECHTVFYQNDISEAAGVLQKHQKLAKMVKDTAKKILFSIGVREHRVQRYGLEQRRKRIFSKFSKEYLHLAENITFTHIPPDFKERYDYFCAGSDQVWHNWSGTRAELDYFFLKFADRRQRICLSPSFGRDEIPEGEKEYYRDALNGFDRLSCREASGVELIRSLTGREAVLLADPAMVLERAEWEKLSRKPSWVVPARYLLLYLLGDEIPETLETIRRYATLLGTEIVNIYDIEREPEHYLTGPCEFLYLIQNAQLVCTNSFHGTVFSILFHTNFVCFPREDSGNDKIGDMSNRIITLLDKFDFQDRFFHTVQDADLLRMDFSGVDEQLAVERKRMTDYMKESLNKDQEEC